MRVEAAKSIKGKTDRDVGLVLALFDVGGPLSRRETRKIIKSKKSNPFALLLV